MMEKIYCKTKIFPGWYGAGIFHSPHAKYVCAMPVLVIEMQ